MNRMQPVLVPHDFISPQNFTTTNYGAYFAPVGRSGMNLAASASPLIGHTVPVHSAPVSYRMPGTISRVLGAIGFPNMGG